MNKIKKPVIVANWKMNPVSLKEAKTLFEKVRSEVKKISKKNAEVIICPPYVWLDALKGASSAPRANLQLSLGAQNCFWESKGAFTGEVSPLMLKNLGCRYVIIGHSERRYIMGETDEAINQKIKTAIRCGLKAILCVGEKERKDDESGAKATEDINLIVGKQLEKALADISAGKIINITIAYEPVWAIGTGNPCSPDQAMKATLFIRKVLTKLYNRNIAEQIKVLYGGSINSKNAAAYVIDAQMNGLLVGGASLQASEFVKIIEKATS